MPAKNPRLSIVLEQPAYDAISRLAKRSGSSLSQKAHELLLEALEAHEDRVLAVVTEPRSASFDRGSALTHEQVWGPEPATRAKRR